MKDKQNHLHLLQNKCSEITSVTFDWLHIFSSISPIVTNFSDFFYCNSVKFFMIAKAAVQNSISKIAIEKQSGQERTRIEEEQQ